MAAGADGGSVSNHAEVNAILAATRAFVALAERSLAAVATDITLPQYRALVVLAQGGQRAADLASALGVAPSTATRMCDRLVRKGLIWRRRPEDDRRTLEIFISERGTELVRQVSLERRREVERIVELMSESGRRGMVRGLKAFAAAAGEAPDQDWSLGWEG